MIRSASFAAVLPVLAVLFCGGIATAQQLAAAGGPAADLPFHRSLAASGTVSGTLEESALVAGVPARALGELLQAFAEAIDLEHDVRDGDRFYVRYERTFSLDGEAIDGGRVLWAELQLASRKSTVALHRFRPADDARDGLWLASGQGAVAATLRFPLESYVLSSGFGLRVDPLDQPAWAGFGTSPSAWRPLGKGSTRAPLPPALGSNLGSTSGSAPGGSLASLNAATPLGLSMGLAPNAAATVRAPAARGVMALHEGVDLVASYGTPILAAGDGIVKGAEPKGRYGNWIEIDHEGDLATVYGHLASFAPGIGPGTAVTRGELIGFVGLTGRTTGPHVHFEVRFKGRPVNPMVYSALKHPQLRGPDLVRFRALVARNLAERDRDARAASVGL
jgi:murein DD-endopeptidase MepM/ murein hydrolase activator NlpD